MQTPTSVQVNETHKHFWDLEIQTDNVIIVSNKKKDMTLSFKCQGVG